MCVYIYVKWKYYIFMKYKINARPDFKKKMWHCSIVKYKYPSLPSPSSPALRAAVGININHSTKKTEVYNKSYFISLCYATPNNFNNRHIVGHCVLVCVYRESYHRHFLKWIISKPHFNTLITVAYCTRWICSSMDMIIYDLLFNLFIINIWFYYN